MNIIEGIQQEMNRCREALKGYEEIGPTGAFAAGWIREAIKEGEAAIASGDVVRMIAAHKELEGVKY